MKKPDISVVIPTYNRPYELAECLETLAAQHYEGGLEVVIVNDCGTPVDHVAALYPELTIKLHNMESNQKHVHARNRGVELADGDWIILCDDDDILLPGHLDRVAALTELADFVYSDVEIFDYTTVNHTRVPTSRRLFAYAYDPAGMRHFSTYVPSGCLFRKNIHRELGGFDPEVYHYWDWDFILRAMERYAVARLPVASVLYAFVTGGGNLSDNLEGMRPYLRRLCDKHGLGELPVKNFFLLLEEPEVKNREAASEIVWDGRRIVSRLAKTSDDFDKNRIEFPNGR